MEIIIFIAVVVVAALLWSGYVKTKKAESDQIIDNWQPPKAEDKPWPFGEKLAEGKIHVKTTDVAPTAPADSENRVEAPAPVVESAPAKKPAAKKTAAKPAAAKKTPAKKKSV
jgi:membrane protein implicated in regulation of membrane protease activity